MNGHMIITFADKIPPRHNQLRVSNRSQPMCTRVKYIEYVTYIPGFLSPPWPEGRAEVGRCPTMTRRCPVLLLRRRPSGQSGGPSVVHRDRNLNPRLLRGVKSTVPSGVQMSNDEERRYQIIFGCHSDRAVSSPLATRLLFDNTRSLHRIQMK